MVQKCASAHDRGLITSTCHVHYVNFNLVHTIFIILFYSQHLFSETTESENGKKQRANRNGNCKNVKLEWITVNGIGRVFLGFFTLFT